jgi:hypothetical protein
VKPKALAATADRKRALRKGADAAGADFHRECPDMPETSFPIRYLTPVLLLVAGAMLGACSGGDFGRARDDFRNDDMHRWIGAEATSSVGLKASQFQLTDSERQLRDLAYPLIEPPHSRPAWRTVFGDYQPIASPWRQGAPPFDRTAYGRALIDEPHRSHASRYSQLIDDLRDDITRFELFYAAAIPVLDLDRKRNATLAHISLSPRERADAAARMQENSLIVQWVQQCLERRVSSYRWALERLVLQAPDGMAADADRLIGELAAQTANPPVAARPVVQRPLTTRG